MILIDEDLDPSRTRSHVVHATIEVARGDRRACGSTCRFIAGAFLNHHCALYQEPLADFPRGNRPLVIARCQTCTEETP